MSKFLIDTDVMIWHLRGKKETKDLLKSLQKAGVPMCSPISIIEVQVGVKPGEEEFTNEFLESLNVCNMNREIANKAAEYLTAYREKGITLQILDAIIAATCVVRDLILVTYHDRHYPMPEIRVYPIIPFDFLPKNMK